MSGVNKAIIVGRLGKDPEVRYTPGGQAVANFPVATSDNWQDKDGQRQERTEWHRIVVWGKLAELCGQYLAKGREVYTEGRLQTREWTDRDGNKRYTTEVVANQVTFLGSRADNPSASSDGSNSRGSYSITAGEAGVSPSAKTPNNGHSAAASYGAPNGGAPSGSPPPSKSQDSSFDYGPPPTDDDVPF